MSHVPDLPLINMFCTSVHNLKGISIYIFFSKHFLYVKNVINMLNFQHFPLNLRNEWRKLDYIQHFHSLLGARNLTPNFLWALQISKQPANHFGRIPVLNNGERFATMQSRELCNLRDNTKIDIAHYNDCVKQFFISSGVFIAGTLGIITNLLSTLGIKFCTWRPHLQ